MEPTNERRPLPSSLTVLEARDAYLAENGFDTSGYTESTFDVEAFGRKYTFENTKDRKWAIPLHDLHHVATGYGTDLVGEAEIGAFELMGGCKTTIVYALNIVAVIVGMIVAPVRTLRAFAASRHARALYRQSSDYEELLALPLGVLRERLGLPREGLTAEPRRLHDERERLRADALPSAPPSTLAASLLGSVHGVGTFAVVVLDGAPRWIGIAVAALAFLLAASAWPARRGSLGARAVFGHAAFGLVVLTLVSFAAFEMAPGRAALSIAVPILVVWTLARRAGGVPDAHGARSRDRSST